MRNIICTKEYFAIGGFMLFVTKIVEEDLVKKENEDIVSKCTELIQVKEAIDRINGESKTAVILEKDSQNFMVVGGGQNSKFVCYAYLKGKKYSMANKFPIPRDGMELIVGGKKGNYPSRRLMGKEMILEAAKHFADRGVLAQTFNWES